LCSGQSVPHVHVHLVPRSTNSDDWLKEDQIHSEIESFQFSNEEKENEEEDDKNEEEEEGEMKEGDGRRMKRRENRSMEEMRNEAIILKELLLLNLDLDDDKESSS